MGSKARMRESVVVVATIGEVNRTPIEAVPRRETADLATGEAAVPVEEEEVGGRSGDSVPAAEAAEVDTIKEDPQ